MASSKQRRRMDAQIFRLKEKTSQIPSTKCSVFMAGNKLKKSESLQTEGRHFRSMICKLSDV